MMRVVRPPAAPTVFNATPESLRLNTIRLIDEARAAQAAVIASVSPEKATFANTVLPLAQEENQRLYERQLIEFYATLSSDERLRIASEEAERRFSQFDIETAQRSDLYGLYAGVRDSSDVSSASPESRRLLQKILLGFERNGLSMPEEGRAQLRQVNEAIAQVRQEYLKICEQNSSVLLFTEDELEGLDSSVIADLDASVEEAGKLRLTVDRAQYWDVMRNLRQSKASLLGYSSFAQYEMAEMMEKCPQQIQAFLNDLLKRISAKGDFATEMRHLKQSDLSARRERDDGHFYDWDRYYYNRKVSAQGHAADNNVVSEYFELSETSSRMLRIFERVFGMKFVDIQDDDRDVLFESHGKDPLIWHDDVRVYAVWDDSKEDNGSDDFLGYLYMDMYARAGKRQGACDLPIRPGYTDVNGSRVYPSTCLICNFNKPTVTRPSLLEHNQVILLFHELGHGIHDLVGKSQYARFHGASCAGDFNEVPSQLLEHWCWHPATLRMLSQHYSTLSPEYMQTWRSRGGGSGTVEQVGNAGAMPEDLIEKLARSKRTRNVSRTLGILNASLFQMAINSPNAPEAAKAIDTTELYHSQLRNVLGLDVPGDTELPPIQACQPEHFTIMGMYTYIVSQIYATDMFQAAFASNPMSETEGMRYRRTVIGKGSSEDEMKMLTDFLGRAPTPDAFYEGLGLGPSSGRE
ncbi:hypothetical protein LTR85_008907 [Meristemomyces frigidus]|nr:hypothetical protein LTR85_008907 [Meristemomyces frigidus]